MRLLANGAIAVVGGGGRMKSGVSNGCEVHTFDERTVAFSKNSALTLGNAATALATHGNLLVTVIGVGCKNFLYQDGQLAEESDFEHDIHVSSTEEQSSLAFSVDGTRLIVASDSGPMRVLRYPECEPLVTARIHSQGVNDMEISTDGRLVASVARDNCAFVWRTDDGETVQLLQPVFKEQLKSSIKGVRFSPVDDMLLFAVESNPRKGGSCLSAWRNQGGPKAPWVRQTHIIALKEAVSTFGISPNGKLLACASVEGHVSLVSWTGTGFRREWNTEDGGSLFRPAKPSHALPVTSICFTSSNEYLFSASADWTVAAWSVRRRVTVSTVFRWLRQVTWLIVLLISVAIGMLHSGERVVIERHMPVLQKYRGIANTQLGQVYFPLKNATKPSFRPSKPRKHPSREKCDVSTRARVSSTSSAAPSFEQGAQRSSRPDSTFSKTSSDTPSLEIDTEPLMSPSSIYSMVPSTSPSLLEETQPSSSPSTTYSRRPPVDTSLIETTPPSSSPDSTYPARATTTLATVGESVPSSPPNSTYSLSNSTVPSVIEKAQPSTTSGTTFSASQSTAPSLFEEEQQLSSSPSATISEAPSAASTLLQEAELSSSPSATISEALSAAPTLLQEAELSSSPYSAVSNRLSTASPDVKGVRHSPTPVHSSYETPSPFDDNSDAEQGISEDLSEVENDEAEENEGEEMATDGATDSSRTPSAMCSRISLRTQMRSATWTSRTISKDEEETERSERI